MMTIDECIAVDPTVDGLYAVLKDGTRLPVKRGGSILSDYGSGWQPTFIYAGFGAILLLELLHQDGSEGTWFLDTELNILPSGFDELDASYRQAIQVLAACKIDFLMRHILSDTSCTSPVGQSILRVNRVTLEQILRGRVLSEPPTTCYLLLDKLAVDSVRLQSANSGNQVKVSVDIMQRMMGQRIVDMVAKAVGAGMISFMSPVDGHLVFTNTCICISTFVIIYKCYDNRHDLVFHVITSTHVCRVIAVYFPNTDECYSINKSEEIALCNQLPHHSVEKAFKNHLIRYGSLLLPYLVKASRDLACLAWHRHLGHHLWQDLTGIDTVERMVGAAKMPKYMMVSSDRSEMFGPIDVLFPSLKGQVDRSCNDVLDLIRKVYQDGICLLSPSDSVIRKTLSNRIIMNAISLQDLDGDRRKLGLYKSLNIPIILLGLRVENRTVVDFSSFCESLVDIIDQETGGLAVIVIDGHNRSGSTVFESVSDRHARKTPIEVEYEIAARLTSKCVKSGIQIIDLIGSPMSKSVFWSHHCDFFITPWGAGLAKYSWIANKPGLVLAGYMYQKNGFDLHIYDSPEFVEDPREMTILDIDNVEDDPEDECLVVTNEVQRTNFRVDLEGVRQEVRRLLLSKDPQ